MPACGCISGIDQDPRRWELCRRQVSQQMISEGWNKHAGKFGMVLKRKAIKLFYKK